jgi:hypothetical protein
MVFSAVMLRTRDAVTERFPQVTIERKQRFLRYFILDQDDMDHPVMDTTLSSTHQG